MREAGNEVGRALEIWRAARRAARAEEGYCILGLKDIGKVSIEEYKEILTPFMSDLESELKGFERVFNFDFAINNLIKRYENQKESLRYWREK